jgi:hypothetical protein
MPTLKVFASSSSDSEKILERARLIERYPAFLAVDATPKNAASIARQFPLGTGDGSTATVTLSSSTKTLRVVMAYTDYPGETLINNLNLIVTVPDGKKYVGNHTAAMSNVSAGPQDFRAGGGPHLTVSGSFSGFRGYPGCPG